ncbi:MAG TPA: hypothetical protein VME68_12675, partial [Acidobacteriaceae bacterium]|nr:hypothetical protein [Acidobacteriaceae bacterium]
MKFSPTGPGLFLALLAACGAACAQTPAPLTLAQVLDIARAKNPSLLAAAQHVTATKASEIT